MPEVKLHKYQMAVIQSTKRFVAFLGGTGSGKTYVEGIFLAQEIQKFPKDYFFVIAPTSKILQRAALPALINHYKGTYLEGEYKESKMQYLLPTGGVIYFGSADNPDSLDGPHVRSLVMDEASLMHRMAWTVSQARVGKNLGRILIASTPRNFGWLYRDVYKRYLDGDKDYDVIQCRSIDNPHYPLEEFERMRKTLDPRVFQMRYCAIFQRMTGQVYPDFGVENIVDNCDRELVEIRAGVDFGFNNPSCILIVGRDSDNNWFILDEWYERGKLLEDVIQQAKLFCQKYQIGIFYCDPSRPDFIAAFNFSGLPAVGADNTITTGIEIVRSFIKTKQLKILINCKNLIDEIEVYHYPEDSEKDIPVKDQDHGCDAMRYALRGIGEKEEVEEEIIFTQDDIGLPRVSIGDY